jgi:hypothetical protein
MNKTVLSLFVGVAVALAAGSAAAQTSPPSDVFKLIFPGVPVNTYIIPEDATELPIHFPGVDGDPGMVVHPLVLLEPSGEISDVIGVMPLNSPYGNGNQIGIMSDVGEKGIDPGFAASVFGIPVLPPGISEPNGPLDVTQYLHPSMQANGATATFQSDNEVPEPSTVALLGMGALGLLTYAWRRRKRA